MNPGKYDGVSFYHHNRRVRGIVTSPGRLSSQVEVEVNGTLQTITVPNAELTRLHQGRDVMRLYAALVEASCE